MSQQNVRVGTVGFPVGQKNLLSRIDVVELSDSYTAVPKSQTGKKRREATPPHISFAVQLPKQLFEAPRPGATLAGDLPGYGEFQCTDENKGLFAKAVRYADTLSADTLVLVTPSDFTPAKPRREALQRFLASVDRGGKTLVWQPSGPWEVERAAAFAEEIDAVLAVDPLRDPPPAGDTCYLRLGPFAAMGSRVGNFDLEQIAQIAVSFERTTVIFDTNRAFDDAKNLKTVLAEGIVEEEEDDDFDDDDDDEA